jgi:hypothetical protein
MYILFGVSPFKRVGYTTINRIDSCTVVFLIKKPYAKHLRSTLPHSMLSFFASTIDFILLLQKRADAILVLRNSASSAGYELAKDRIFDNFEKLVVSQRMRLLCASLYLKIICSSTCLNSMSKVSKITSLPKITLPNFHLVPMQQVHLSDG